MNSKFLFWLLTTVLLATPPLAEAQQPKGSGQDLDLRKTDE